MLRIPARLSPELETMVHRVIGCCIAVHRALGPGLLEGIYTRAICIELTADGISFDTEKEFPVAYRGELLCKQKLDFAVANEIVLEIKSVENLGPVHRAQLLNYLHISKLPIGLLMNFNVAVLQDGIKRIVL